MLGKKIKIFQYICLYFLMTGITALIALAWNNVFVDVLRKYFPDKNQTIYGLIIYAICLTMIGSFALLFVFGTENVQRFVLQDLVTV